MRGAISLFPLEAIFHPMKVYCGLLQGATGDSLKMIIGFIQYHSCLLAQRRYWKKTTPPPFTVSTPKPYDLTPIGRGNIAECQPKQGPLSCLYLNYFSKCNHKIWKCSECKIRSLWYVHSREHLQRAEGGRVEGEADTVGCLLHWIR